jgi:leucyl aminopeptidase
MSEEKELGFYFMPLSDLTFRKDTLVLAYLFEEQEDAGISEHFPEFEARRQAIDRIHVKGEEIASFQTIVRNEQVYNAGMIYIKFPWKRVKEMTVDSINFMREVWTSTTLAVRRTRDEGFEKIGIVLPSRFSPQNLKDRNQREQLYFFVRMVTEAIIYANNTYDDFMTIKKKVVKEVTFVFFGQSEQAVDGFFKKALGDGQLIGSNLALTRRLIEIPPNHKSPLDFVSLIVGRNVKPFESLSPEQKSAGSDWKKFTISPRVSASLLYGVDSLRANGFELISAVGVGSTGGDKNQEPCLLKIHYKPKTQRKKRIKKVVITAKGVVFDSGGYDIKGTDYYDNMHYDMAGAATAWGVVHLAEEMNLPVEIIAVIPIVQNLIGPKGTLPGTILKAYGGQTVKIVNTDCEGRLILAEAIAYSQKKISDADLNITIGTLSDMKDFGPDFLKVAVTSPVLEKKVRKAERLSTEKVFLMPPMDHFNHVDAMHVGDQSDLLNDVWGCYYVSPIVFLYNFFEYERPNWVFLDVSAVFESWADAYGAGPGFGLKFAWQLLQQFA